MWFFTRLLFAAGILLTRSFIRSFIRSFTHYLFLTTTLLTCDYTCLLFTADICPPVYPPEYEVPFAWFDKTDNGIGANITFTCQGGYLYPDRTRIKTMECLSGGVWSELPPACERKRKLIAVRIDTVESWQDMVKSVFYPLRLIGSILTLDITNPKQQKTNSNINTYIIVKRQNDILSGRDFIHTLLL